ncbi:hypothetical protein [Microcoleus sp. herbarium12]
MRDCLNSHSRSHKVDLSLSRTLHPNQPATTGLNLKQAISNYVLAITNYR